MRKTNTYCLLDTHTHSFEYKLSSGLKVELLYTNIRKEIFLLWRLT